MSKDGYKNYMHEKTLTERFTNALTRHKEQDRDQTPMPVITTGNIWTYGDCEMGMGMGADLIGVGRASIGNPDWPNEIVEHGQKYQPLMPPYSEAHLKESSLSDIFVYYMRRWRFVKDEKDNILPFDE